MKTRLHNHLQFLACAVMEILWLFCWANLTMGLVSSHRFPYLEALCIFLFALVLTYLIEDRQWRRIHKVALQTAAMTVAGLFLIHTYNYPYLPLLAWTWLTDLFTRHHRLEDWFIICMTMVWVTTFWVSGIKLAGRPANYWFVCRRFDFGILMFLGFLVFKIGLIHNDINVEERASGWFILTFLIFGLLAIGLARNHHTVRTTYLTGYRTVGVLLSFALIVMIATISLSSLLWPFLESSAEIGYDLLQVGLRPITPFVVGALTLIFRGSMESFQETTTDNDYIAGGIVRVDGGGSDILGLLLWGIFGGLLVLSLIGILFFGIWRLVRWLLSPQDTDKDGDNSSIGILAWFLEIPGILLFVWDWMSQHLRRKTEITEVYKAFLRWGYYSGFKQGTDETPLEYCNRLSLCFPDLHDDIALITELLQKKIYAEKPISHKEFRCAYGSLKNLRSPSYWPVRLGSRIRCASE